MEEGREKEHGNFAFGRHLAGRGHGPGHTLTVGKFLPVVKGPDQIGHISGQFSASISYTNRSKSYVLSKNGY